MTDRVSLCPSGAIPEVETRPARPGETITLYGIGFGSVSPFMSAGEMAQQSNSLDLPVQVFFEQISAEVPYAGLAPGAIGLYQFNVVVPQVPEGDEVPLTFSLGGVASDQTLRIAARNLG